MDPVEPLVPARGRLTLIFLAVTAVGLIAGVVLERPDTESPLIGRRAPGVVVDAFDGTQWTLSDHLDNDRRPVVLNLWASWCIPCRTEIPELSSFALAHPEIAVVGVAVNDDRQAAAALAAELRPAYLVGTDPTGRLRDDYPSFGLPLTVVIDEAGVIRHEVLGGVTKSVLESFVGD